MAIAVGTIAATSTGGGQAGGPTADHHLHLPSAAAMALLNRSRAGEPPIPNPTIDQVIAQLDAAGIQRGTLLSTAYWFGSAVMPRADGDEYANVKAENDWTAAQAARYPNRLVAFCSVNPLREYAAAEIERCATSGTVRGLKLHFGNSAVNLLVPAHTEVVRRVFALANAHRLAIIAHLWTGESYGRADAETFLTQILPAAPEVMVQIAHFAGAGPGYTDAALAVYADAIARGQPATRNLYFDIAGVANFQPPSVRQAFATRIRQVGLQRVLYGTDVGSPAQSWEIFRTTVPLSDEEIQVISRNIAPYLQQPASN